MNPSLREGEQWRVELSGAAVSAAAGAYRAAALRRSGRPLLA